MINRKILFPLFLLIAIKLSAQNNFQYQPDKPKAGAAITFTYEPGGDLKNVTTPIEGVAYISSDKNTVAQEIVLTKQGKNYTGIVQTDSTQNFFYIAFTSDDKVDNNFNDGYWIQLYDEDKIKKGANISLGNFYRFSNAGVEKNNEKALKYFEQEIALYPDARKKHLLSYIDLLVSAGNADKYALFQKEIESLLKDGLKSEEDYAMLERLYFMASLPEQAKNTIAFKKEKYPNGKWRVNEAIRKFSSEKDLVKKEQLLREMIRKSEMDDVWKDQKETLESYKRELAYAYLAKNDWEGMEKAMIRSGLKQNAIASIYNNAAWKMVESSGIDTIKKYGDKFSGIAVDYAKSEWQKPSTEKPGAYTKKQWDKSRANIYAYYAATYAWILYKLGKYKEGFKYAKDAALVINDGKYPRFNSIYAMLAEKILPAKKYKKELEQFVKDGQATSEIKDILKRAYIKTNRSENGFEDYIATLEKESYLNMIAKLRKSMINVAAPSFALYDLDKNKVDVADLKNKVVVVDFWATWCGPCKASFPGMQKMVNKYKDSSDVKFVFIDTWESGDDKQKKASDFITANKYTFHILLDVDDKVVEQFKVTGVPTKFIIDKNGMIRFKSVGYDGEEKLMQELTAMIELAKKTDEF